MSERLQFPGVQIDPAKTSTTADANSRRRWIAPCLEPHSTMTTVTQSAVTLLFLQASVTQCFNERGRPVACPS